MANSNDFNSAEKDLLVKILGKFAAKMERLTVKSEKDGEKHIATAARKQKTEVDQLINKIL